MTDPLQVGLTVLSLALALVALGHVVLDRRPAPWLLGGLVLLEAGLVVQCVLGIVQLVTGDRDVSAFTFVGYLLGALLILPVGTLWALAEPTRSGAAVLVVATLVVPVLILRLEQVWAGG